MLNSFKNLSIGLGVALLMVSCSKDMENVTPSSTLSGVSTNDAKTAPTPNFDQSTVSSSNNDFSWTFTMKVTSVKANIGALLMNIEECDGSSIASNVTSLTVSSKEGAYSQTLLPSYNEGNGTDCGRRDLSGYVRFTEFTGKLTDGSVYTYTLTFNKPVKVKTINAWARISNTCNAFVVAGPSCVVEEAECGKGHGYFKDIENWLKNGTYMTVSFNGVTYSAEEGEYFMDANGNTAGFTFAQGATLQLNRQLGYVSSTAMQTELDAIEKYLLKFGERLDKTEGSTTIVNSDPIAKAAKDAAGAIGDYFECK